MLTTLLFCMQLLTLVIASKFSPTYID